MTIHREERTCFDYHFAAVAGHIAGYSWIANACTNNYAILHRKNIFPKIPRGRGAIIASFMTIGKITVLDLNTAVILIGGKRRTRIAMGRRRSGAWRGTTTTSSSILDARGRVVRGIRLVVSGRFWRRIKERWVANNNGPRFAKY